jgi:membrane-associated protease RseP (regulator of RpoE activity)
MSSPKLRATPGLIGFLCRAGAVAGFVSASLACAFVYPELSTPLHNRADDQPLEPAPPPDVFYIAVKSAHIPAKTRDGRRWDKLGGAAPDVYAILFINRVEVARTVVVPDSFEPTWTDPNPTNYKLPDGAEVEVELWDENALVSHPICKQMLKGLEEVAAVGETELHCDSGASVVVAVTEPKAKIGIGLYYEIRGKEAYVTRVIAASPAGRAGLRAGDRIATVRGRAVSTLTKGELESILNSSAKAGFDLEVVSAEGGQTRKVELRDEAMYPTRGEGIELK